jgi:hypothetical protein
MSDQVLVAGAALIAFGSFLLGYGLGWGQCTAWRDQLEIETDEMERRTALFLCRQRQSSARERSQ